MQRRWGLALAVGHNLAVLNRLRVARQLDVELRPILQNVEALEKPKWLFKLISVSHLC
jgi:hypothetical protein